MTDVALTGNIASGKSTVAEEWRRLGATVIDSDVLAREAVEPGSPGLAAIQARWGDGVIGEDGSLDRAALRGIVFADPAARKQLEKIVHPEVARLREARRRQAIEQGATLVVSDIPLLFETGLQAQFDQVVLVVSDPSIRRERLVRLRDLDPEEADRMIAAQMPEQQKIPLADYVIENNGSLDDLLMQAATVYRQLSGTEAEGAHNV